MTKQLLPVPFITPAFHGLNTSHASDTTLGPEWALTLQNAIFDISGRVASRNGWVDMSGNNPVAGSPNFVATAEFQKADGSVQQVSATATKLYKGTSAYTDITGTVVAASGDWQFQNFVDQIYGFLPGQKPIVWNGTGNFAPIVETSGAAPTGGAGVAAFGRLWVVDADNNTIKYCGLLDALNWGNAGSGSINMRAIWTRGTDQVVGIAAVGATLVVFGKRHIVLFTDGKGSTLGMDPASMYVVDTIEGTGLVGRDTAVPIGSGDLLYLSPTGIQSLSRALANKNNPLTSVDQHVRDYVKSFTVNETPIKMRAIYSLADQFYLLILPATGRCFAYDTKYPLQDGSLRVTEWTHIAPFSGNVRADNTVVFGQPGRLGLHSGYKDNGISYRFTYISPNVFLGQQIQAQLKMLKRITSIIFTQNSNTITYQWGFDFLGFTQAASLAVAGGLIPEYGSAEYGSNGKYNVNDPAAVAGVNISEYGGGLTLRIQRLPGAGSGRWIQIGLQCDINGSAMAIQQLDLYAKIGGMV